VFEDDYLKQKKALSKNDPGYERKLENAKSGIKKKIIETLGRHVEDVEEEHLKLSQAFGIIVGMTNKRYQSFSIFDYSKKNLALLKANRYPQKEYVVNNCCFNFWNSFNVVYV